MQKWVAGPHEATNSINKNIYTHTHGLLKNEHMNRDDTLIRIILSVNMTLVEISAYTF